MGLNLGALLLEMAVEAAIGAAFTAAWRAVTERQRSAQSMPITFPATRPAHVAPVASPPAALSHVPGRLRLPVAGLLGDTARAAQLEADLVCCPGIVRVSASDLTGNALVHYDPTQTTAAAIHAAIAVSLSPAETAAAQAAA